MSLGSPFFPTCPPYPPWWPSSPASSQGPFGPTLSEASRPSQSTPRSMQSRAKRTGSAYELGAHPLGGRASFDGMGDTTTLVNTPTAKSFESTKSHLAPTHAPARRRKPDDQEPSTQFERHLADAIHTVWFARSIHELHLAHVRATQQHVTERFRRSAQRWHLRVLFLLLIIMASLGIVGTLVWITPTTITIPAAVPRAVLAAVPTNDNPVPVRRVQSHETSAAPEQLSQCQIGHPWSSIASPPRDNPVATEHIAELYGSALNAIDKVRVHQELELAQCHNSCSSRLSAIHDRLDLERHAFMSNLTTMQSSHRQQVGVFERRLEQVVSERLALYALLISRASTFS